MKKLILIILSFIIFFCGIANSEVYHVRTNGNDSNDGLSWQNSFATIQKALDLAFNDDEIWVSEGIYHPSYDYKLNIGERGKHFKLRDYISLIGGFPNKGNPIRTDANHFLYKTIISGDLNKDDKWNEEKQIWENRDENCYHLFFITNDVFFCKLDGLVIQDGNANGNDSLNNSGGGLYLKNVSLQINNCIIKNNYANRGGGINCENLNIIIKNSYIIGNTANSSGGGLYTYWVKLNLTNCVIAENISKTHMGGGMYLYLSISKVSEILNCTIINNSSYADGGGILATCPTQFEINDEFCNLYILNSILYGNICTTFDRSNQLYVAYLEMQGGINAANTTLDYCLIDYGVNMLTYSNNYPYNGLKLKFCIENADPGFLGKGENPYMLTRKSRCLDMGNNDYIKEEYDIRGFPRKVNKKDSTLEKIVDIGAYEYNYPLDVVSVEDNDNLSTISIYPNPASDYITISIPELNKGLQPLVQSVRIFNTLGFEVGQTPPSMITGQTRASDLLKIDISHLPTGVYFVRITGSNGARSIVEKFVKM